VERKVFLAAGALVAALATDACAKGGASELEIVEGKSEFDYAGFAKVMDRPAAVHQLWDIDGYVPRALGAIKSCYNGYQFGYGIAPSSIAMVACLHGYANAFAYDDSMWSKYKIGEAFGFKDPSGNVVATNIFYHARSQPETTADPNDGASMYQDGTLEALQRRGLNVLVCHTAAAEQARTLVAAGAAPQASTPSDVLADILAHLMPGTMIVPSMVATVGILQNRFKYAYTTVNPN
jgi:hypothetical protein